MSEQKSRYSFSMSHKGSRSLLHDSKERRNRDLRYTKRDAVIHDQRVNSLWKAAMLQMGHCDDERTKLLREQSTLEQQKTKRKDDDEKVMVNDTKENETYDFPKESTDSETGANVLNTIKDLLIKDALKQVRSPFPSWSTVSWGRNRKKKEMKTLIKPCEIPISKKKITKLSTPIVFTRSKTCSAICLNNGESPRNINSPRSICQLRSLSSKEYEKLMNLRPKTANMKVDRPSPTSEAMHSKVSKTFRNKMDSSRFQASHHNSVTSYSISVKELISCRYLYTYRADTPLDTSEIFDTTRNSKL